MTAPRTIRVELGGGGSFATRLPDGRWVGCEFEDTQGEEIEVELHEVEREDDDGR